MQTFYVGYNRSADSYSVFQYGRKNEFGEPFCVLPLVTKHEAQTEADRLNTLLARSTNPMLDWDERQRADHTLRQAIAA